MIFNRHRFQFPFTCPASPLWATGSNQILSYRTGRALGAAFVDSIDFYVLRRDRSSELLGWWTWSPRAVWFTAHLGSAHMTHVHQPICNKSHFTVWLEVSLLDVYSISDGFQLCCQASKISLMDYQKPIIKCSPMDIQPLNLWHAFCCITELARLSFIQCVCTCAERALILGKFLHAF